MSQAPETEPKAPKASAANGRVCCILDLACCIPPPGVTREGARKIALAGLIRKVCSNVTPDDAIELADTLLAEFDLVPAGVGRAIASGYSQWIKLSTG